MLDSVVLLLKAQFHNLGVVLDPEMLLDVHMAAVVKNAYYQLTIVCQLRPLLHSKILPVTHALRISRLNYCNMLYSFLQKAKKISNVAE